MKKVVNILLLFIPIFFSCAACFLGPKVYEYLFNGKIMSELIRYIITIVFFLIPTVIIFIKTRGINPMIKIHTPQFTESNKEQN